MSEIRILPEILTNKIAAGEVVERPGSVVKELLENALDAGADRISIEVSDGGKSLIRVSDNGCGMDRDDALLCLERYATSKIKTDEDLFEIHTLGFRGEALPSIASVSALTLISRSAEGECASVIRVEAGRMLDVAETGAPVGTVVSVSRLFHNVPARKKFLKSAATEMGHVAETVTSAALCRPDVSFTLIHNGREVFSWPAAKNPEARFHAVLGYETGRDLIPVFFGTDAASISGVLAPPELSRSTSRSLYLFVNKRVVADRLLMHAVMEGFSGRLTRGRYPVAVISVDAPHAEVDVNVHPAKAQVRFARSKEVHATLVRAVSKALSESEAARVPWEASPAPPPQPSGPAFSGSGGRGPESASGAAAIARDLGLGQFPARAPLPSHARKIEAEAPTDTHRQQAPALSGASVAEPVAAFLIEREGAFEAPCRIAPPASLVQASVFPQKAAGPEQFRVIGQMRSSYIVCESGQGLMIIDQHAAHERVMFEKFKAQLMAGRIEAEILLFPETLTLSHAEADALVGILPEISGLGLEIEPFSGNAFVIKAAPSFLGGRPLAQLVRQLAEKALEIESANDMPRIMDEVVALTACHGAVRANQNLSLEEMKRLVSDLSSCPDPAHCPHGRPTWILWTNAEIERDFKRK
ncbi:MAG: DNA mismatch repair endonuclease MutL [Deltaproteobacteria bacterium]|nr:DNA mismatch repair endonuclease MutL [Deltaproteobacteria bacterium]